MTWRLAWCPMPCVWWRVPCLTQVHSWEVEKLRIGHHSSDWLLWSSKPYCLVHRKQPQTSPQLGTFGAASLSRHFFDLIFPIAVGTKIGDDMRWKSASHHIVYSMTCVGECNTPYCYQLWKFPARIYQGILCFAPSPLQYF